MDRARASARALAALSAAALLAVSCLYDYGGALSAGSSGDGGGASSGGSTGSTTGGPSASTSVTTAGSGDGGGSTATSGGLGGAGGVGSSSADATATTDASSTVTTDAASTSTGPAPCPGDDFRLDVTGHCYRKLTPRTWDQARTQCQDIGMHLVTLDGTENEALRVSGQIGEATWSGGRREGNTATFGWVVGAEGFPFNPPWNMPAEASDPGGDDCVSVLVDGTWGLRVCDNVIPALCETF